MRSPSKLPVAPGLFALLTLAALACSSLMAKPPATGIPGGQASQAADTTTIPTQESLAQTLMQTAEAAASQVAPAAGAAMSTVQAAASQAQPTVEAATTQLQPTLQAVMQTAQASLGQLMPTIEALGTQAGNIVQTPQPVGQGSAASVVQAYAQQILGTSVTVQKAGGLTADIASQIKIPPSALSAQDAVAKVALQTYGALLNGGAGSVSYGSGAVSGDVSADINSSSLGAFSFELNTSPATEADAKAAALQAFPGLSSRSFTAETASAGFAWKAQRQTPGFDPKTKQPTLVNETVLLGIIPGSAGKSTAYAVVGKGDFAAQLNP
jgi:hypothetical protein